MVDSVRDLTERPPFRFRLTSKEPTSGSGRIVLFALGMTLVEVAAVLLMVRMPRAVPSESFSGRSAEPALVFVEIAPNHPPFTQPMETRAKNRSLRTGESLTSRPPVDRTAVPVDETTSQSIEATRLPRTVLAPSKSFPTATRVPSTCARGPCMSSGRSGVSAPYGGEIRSAVNTRWSLMRGIKDSPKLQPTDAERRSAAFVSRHSPMTVMVGGGVSIGLWGGGPSAAQRRRDSTIHAANKMVFARMKARADSAVAARRDSIAPRQTGDSILN